MRASIARPRIWGAITSSEAQLDTIVTVHSLLRWLVLVALIGGLVVAFAASRRPGEAFADPVFSGIAIVVDVQVTLGIILWLFNSGWDQGFFIAVFHPIAMILALGVMHMAIARGRRTAKADHAAGNRIVAMGMLITLILVFAAIPWQRM